MRAYFDRHLDQFDKQDVVNAQVLPWQEDRTGESDALTIDGDSVRVLHEQDDALVAAALGLEIAEEALVELEGGSYLQVTCTNRLDAGHESFEDVPQAALSQHITQRFRRCGPKRIGAAENQ